MLSFWRSKRRCFRWCLDFSNQSHIATTSSEYSHDLTAIGTVGSVSTDRDVLSLSLAGDRQTSHPDAFQLLRELRERYPSLVPRIEQGLFDHYLPYKEAVEAGIEMNNPFPQIAKTSEVWPHVKPAHVLIEPIKGQGRVRHRLHHRLGHRTHGSSDLFRLAVHRTQRKRGRNLMLAVGSPPNPKLLSGTQRECRLQRPVYFRRQVPSRSDFFQAQSRQRLSATTRFAGNFQLLAHDGSEAARSLNWYFVCSVRPVGADHSALPLSHLLRGLYG